MSLASSGNGNPYGIMQQVVYDQTKVSKSHTKTAG